MEETNVSLSDLLKKSAKAICYFRNKKKQFPITSGMIEGNKVAERKTISELKEMRGTYKYKKFLIHYSFDEIQIEKSNDLILLEHKNITEGSIIEDWYIQYSILQTAVYRAFLELNPSKEYFTAKFFRKLGYNTNYIDINRYGKRTSILYIGDVKYEIGLYSAKDLVNFYIKKCKATKKYESAIDWDAEWKFKEFEHLVSNLEYCKI